MLPTFYTPPPIENNVLIDNSPIIPQESTSAKICSLGTSVITTLIYYITFKQFSFSQVTRSQKSELDVYIEDLRQENAKLKGAVAIAQVKDWCRIFCDCF